MLLLLVAVVGKDRPELGIRCRVHTLLIPIDRLQLLHETDDRPVHVARLESEVLLRLVKARGT
jgi:hypothetical protein